MTNREKFIKEITILITSKGNDPAEVLSEGALSYWNEFVDGKASLGGITEKGKEILEWLNTKDHQNDFYSAKLIGEGLFTSSRVISGAARKLVTDGYLEKEGKNPVTYRITTSGHNILLGSENH